MTNEYKTMGFEEWLKVMAAMSKGDLDNCISGGNIHVDISASPTRAKEGLIRTGKFKLTEYNPDWQGKFQLEHLGVEEQVLVKYEGISRDYEMGKWREPEPNECKITLHPSPIRVTFPKGYCLAKSILPDVLEFGKSEKIGLRAFCKIPLIDGNKTDYETVEVRYNPQS